MKIFDLTDFQNSLNDGDKQYFIDHKKRFELSLEWINTIVTPTTHVLEIGSPNMFTDIFTKYLTCGKYCNTWQDLRKPIEYSSEVFDVILFMEVIEHVKDPEEVGGYNETFRGCGQLNLLKECGRMLRPGGKLFLTTPNPNSMTSLRKLLYYDHPFTYWYHIREMSQLDLKKNLKESELSIERYETVESWYHITDEDKKILESLSKFGFSSDYREDDIFIVAKK